MAPFSWFEGRAAGPGSRGCWVSRGRTAVLAPGAPSWAEGGGPRPPGPPRRRALSGGRTCNAPFRPLRWAGGPGVAPQNPQGLLRTALAGGPRPQTGRPLPCWTHTAPGEPLASEGGPGSPAPADRPAGAPATCTGGACPDSFPLSLGGAWQVGGAGGSLGSRSPTGGGELLDDRSAPDFGGTGGQRPRGNMSTVNSRNGGPLPVLRGHVRLRGPGRPIGYTLGHERAATRSLRLRLLFLRKLESTEFPSLYLKGCVPHSVPRTLLPAGNGVPPLREPAPRGHRVRGRTGREPSL